MMRILSFFLSLVIFSSLFSPVFAISPNPSATTSAIIDPGKLEVGDALISPASSIYFLKALRERIELVFSDNNSIKAQRHLEFSVRRLREVNTLIEQNRQDLIEEVLERYKSEINQAKDLSARDDNLRASVGESVARHIYILQTIYNQLNNVNAKRALRASVMEIEAFNNKIIGDLTDPLRQTLIDNISLRQMAGCQFLAGQVGSPDLNEPEKQILQEYVTSCQKESPKSGTIPLK